VHKRLVLSITYAVTVIAFSFSITITEPAYAGKGDILKGAIIVIGKGIGSLGRGIGRLFKGSKPPSGTLAKIGDAALHETTAIVIRGAIKSVSRAPIQPASRKIFQYQNNFLQQSAQNYAPKFVQSAKDKITLKNTAYTIGTYVISDVVFSQVAHATGLNSSSSEDVDAQFNAEIAAGIEQGIEDFYIKVCTDDNGNDYGVPSGAISCLNGTEPKMIEAPMNLREIAESQRGVRSWIGVRFSRVSQELAKSLRLSEPYGVLVEEVTEDSPASRAGIETGDVILEFDGIKIEDMSLLPIMVSETPVNTTVSMEILRNAKKLPLELTVGYRFIEPPTTTSLGMRLESLTRAKREEHELPLDQKGVLVTEVESSSAAEQKGVRKGDVIVEVGQEKVYSAEEAAEKIQVLKDAGRSSALLLVKRDDDVRFAALKFELRHLSVESGCFQQHLHLGLQTSEFPPLANRRDRPRPWSTVAIPA